MNRAPTFNRNLVTRIVPLYVGGRSRYLRVGVKRAATATALFLVAVYAATPLGAETDDPSSTRLALAQRVADVIVARILDEHRLPYLGLAVFHGDQTVFKAHGYHDETRTVAFDARRSIVRAASVAKLPVALVAAELLAEHGIDPNEPVRDHVRTFGVPTHERTPIRFNHLFSHTEGFEARSVGIKTFDPHQLVPLRQLLRDTPPLTFQRPGLMVTYGNWASAVLGGVIEELSSTSFAEAMQQRLFDPAGMSDSTFLQPLPSELAERRAPDYRYQGAQLRRLEPTWSQLVPASGLHTTVADAARLMGLLLRDGQRASQTVLSRDTVQRALETQFRVHPRLPGVTLGFLEEEHSGLRMLVRDGDSEGVMSRMILVPQADVGVFLVTGSDSKTPRTDAARLLGEGLCAEIDCPAPYDGYPELMTVEPLKPYTGIYSLANRPRHDVSRLPVQVTTLLRVSTAQAGTLLVTPLSDDPFAGIDRATEFRPLGEQLFEAVDRSIRIAFVRGPLGEVRYLFTGAGYHGSYEKLRPWERLYFALAGLLLPMVLCVVTTLMRLIGILSRRRPESGRRQRLQSGGITVCAATMTAFGVLAIPAIAFVGMAPGLPAWVPGLGGFAYVVFSLPIIALAAILWVLALGARSVATGFAISVPEGIMDRLLLGSVPILFVALYHWRLLGYWF
ncbi:MAG: class A beta-lactamase-related serine hydrolase [Spirochaetaceae bacterium]|nr:MAG: class A beta-lactamase-related serine hydrolase [Spirochaetaceae bacterium]